MSVIYGDWAGLDQMIAGGDLFKVESRKASSLNVNERGCAGVHVLQFRELL